MGERATCKGKSLASSDDNGEGLGEDKVNKDTCKLTVATLEQQFDKIPVSSWYMSMIIPLWVFFSVIGLTKCLCQQMMVN